MCTHAAVMRAGKLVAQGTLDELRGSAGAVAALQTPDAALAREILTAHRLSLEPAAAPDTLLVTLPVGTAPEDVVAWLVRGGARVRQFTMHGASLEDRFVELTGEGFDVAD
jgi:ABC-2 type transport system ATP-binding protein